MALVVKDRVKVYSSTTGTGTLSLGSAFAGFQTFNNALGDGDTTYYGIFESSTGNWEVGLGTYTSSGNTLSRDTILESSNAGAAVNLTADTEVFITYPAEKSVYFDASGDLILNQDPTSNLQAATKQYVDTIAAAGLHYHAPVRVQTTANLTATYNNGSSGVGATLTNSGTQAAISIDNVTLSSADRVLVSEQTNAAHNGVYTVTNVGSASTNWVLTRATDADSYGPSDPDSLGEGDAFFIKEGDTNAGHLDVMTTSGEIVFGTTNIVFSEVAETTVYSAGTGLSLSGTEFNVGAGTGITVDATTVSTVQDIATSATPQFDGLTTTGNITFGDNDKAIFGAGSDLQIYHDGSNSYIKDAGTGDLKIQGANVRLENPSGVRYFQGSSGNAYLYNSGDIKLATTSTGIDVTGTVTADGLTVDGTNDVALITTNQSNYTEGLTLRNTANYGYGTSLSFEAKPVSGGSTSEVGRIQSAWDSNLYHSLKFYTLNNNTLQQSLKIAGNGDISFYEDTGTTATFYWDASAMELAIGTDTPVNPLTIQQTSINWPYIALTNTSGTIKSQFGYQVGDDLLDIAANSGGIKFRTNNTETMRLTSAGKLGVNVQTPDGRLEVQQAQNSATAGSFSGPHLRLNNSTTTDVTGFTGIAYSGSTVDNYGWTSGVQRTSTNGTEVDFIWRHHSNSDTGTEAMRIHSSGHVTVNTTSDNNAMLEVLQDTDGYSRGLRSSSQSDATTYAALAMVNGTDAALTAGSASSVNTNLTFYTATGGTETEAMRINSSGWLLVGTTTGNLAYSTVNTGSAQYPDGSHANSRDGGIAGYYNRLTSDGNIVVFNKDGTTVGSIGAENGADLTIGNGDTGLRFSATNDSIRPFNMSTIANRDNAVDLGDSSTRFKDLYLGGTAYVDGLTIDNSTQTSFNVEYANDGAGIGPILRTFRDSASPAIADALGGIDFKGNNSAGSEKFYARIKGVIIDPADTTEDGAVEISVSKAGTAAWETSALVAKFDPNGMELRGDLRFEGATADNFETTLTVTDPTADRTITLPDATGTVWTSGNDGSGSGLDADTVDGIQASSFLRSDAADTATGQITFAPTGIQGATIFGSATQTNYMNLVIYSNSGSGQIWKSGTGYTSYGGASSLNIYNSNANIAFFSNARTTPDVDISGGDVTVAGDIELGGALDVQATTGTWVRSDQMTDSIGWNTSHGVYIGSDTSGSSTYIYGSGKYYDGSTVQTLWHTGNDGSGSGLDADTVDGLQASSFLRSDANDSFTGVLDAGSGNATAYRFNGRSFSWNSAMQSPTSYIPHVMQQSYNGWDPVLGIKTSNGFWQFGAYSNDILHLGYMSGAFGSHSTNAFDNSLTISPSTMTFNGNTIWNAGNATGAGYVDTATGSYGTIKVDDDRGVTWAGYAIRDDWVFMSSGAGTCGIYNDTNNEWSLLCYQNAQVQLRYDNTTRFETTSGGAAVTGALTATGDITAYYSDERLKNFEGKIDGALDKVSKLSGYYFRENDKAKELGFDNDDRQVGVSAQEVEAVLPEVIKPAPVDPEYKTVQYEKLVPLLIEAIKELKEEVRQLKEDKA